jgi:hypothetical protein
MIFDALEERAMNDDVAYAALMRHSHGMPLLEVAAHLIPMLLDERKRLMEMVVRRAETECVPIIVLKG